jgi:hypothetical protein
MPADAISSDFGIDEIAQARWKNMNKNKNKFVDTGMSIKDVYYCTLWVFSKMVALALVALYPVLEPIVKKKPLRCDIKNLFRFNPYSFFRPKKRWRYT